MINALCLITIVSSNFEQSNVRVKLKLLLLSLKLIKTRLMFEESIKSTNRSTLMMQQKTRNREKNNVR